MMNLGERIKLVREVKGISKTEMSVRLGMSRQRYSSREDTNYRFRLDELQNIASALDITINELLGI